MYEPLSRFSSMTRTETPGPSCGPGDHSDDPACCASATIGTARVPTTDAKNARRVITAMYPSSTIRKPSRPVVHLGDSSIVVQSGAGGSRASRARRASAAARCTASHGLLAHASPASAVSECSKPLRKNCAPAVVAPQLQVVLLTRHPRHDVAVTRHDSGASPRPAPPCSNA